MDANELRDHLSQTLTDLRDGKVKWQQAQAAADVAAQMIASAKVQVAYYALRGQAPAIPFLDSKRAAEARVHQLPG